MPHRLDGYSKPELPASHYLDNRIYTDPGVFEKEKATVLSRCWRLVCHESEIPAVFDYRLVEVAGQELILLRGEDNVVRGLQQLCTSRCTPVAPAGGKSQAGKNDLLLSPLEF